MIENGKIIKPIKFDKQEITLLIMEQFENILDKNDITIPYNNREGNENESRIYGETQYQLEDTINDILTEFVENRVLKPICKNNNIMNEKLIEIKNFMSELKIMIPQK